MQISPLHDCKVCNAYVSNRDDGVTEAAVTSVRESIASSSLIVDEVLVEVVHMVVLSISAASS